MLREYFLTTGRLVLLIWVLIVIWISAEYQYWYAMLAGAASVYWFIPWWWLKDKRIPKGANYDVFNVIIGTVLFMVSYNLFMLEM